VGRPRIRSGEARQLVADGVPQRSRGCNRKRWTSRPGHCLQHLKVAGRKRVRQTATPAQVDRAGRVRQPDGQRRLRTARLGSAGQGARRSRHRCACQAESGRRHRAGRFASTDQGLTPAPTPPPGWDGAPRNGRTGQRVPSGGETTQPSWLAQAVIRGGGAGGEQPGQLGSARCWSMRSIRARHNARVATMPGRIDAAGGGDGLPTRPPGKGKATLAQTPPGPGKGAPNRCERRWSTSAPLPAWARHNFRGDRSGSGTDSRSPKASTS